MIKVPVIVGLGETLWDIFPDGPRLGGTGGAILVWDDQVSDLPGINELQ